MKYSSFPLIVVVIVGSSYFFNLLIDECGLPIVNLRYIHIKITIIMANLSANHPTIALHICDRNLTPLLTSSRPSQSIQASEATQALHILTTTSINAYETARHLGYGAPQRIMAETVNDGPVLLQSYINPSSVIPRSITNGVVHSTNGFLNHLLDVGRPSTGLSEQSTSTEIANPVGPPVTNGFDTDGYTTDERSNDESTAIQPPPMLFSTVVVPRRTDLGEGRTVAMRMERIGRHFQREWFREQVAEREQASRERSMDGDNNDG